MYAGLIKIDDNDDGVGVGDAETRGLVGSNDIVGWRRKAGVVIGWGWCSRAARNCCGIHRGCISCVVFHEVSYTYSIIFRISVSLPFSLFETFAWSFSFPSFFSLL